MDQEFRIEMIEIKKRFAGVKALDGARLQVRPGEIHALIGENGAGKSTLMKVLAGALKKDGGEIRIDGAKQRYRRRGRPTVWESPLFTRSLCWRPI